ncbi:BspA family leucine-rich repeat surface protein [Lactiplantibacillus sp. WILCCON 0030]|uniref:BspA family leucine-rich repeat surface protein n=1 Tax=Lactiplantibacillus brownii TaxID=3069269 RepID=A0ABU1ABF9_9LACO|nr:BspA family leucine-rich repeat surface protein [Lactiplantibacillus brownii]MDQ7938309.1 BspA family leucine-rich repeat surface protein [Lactiplantibacillus brownii]
MRRRSVMRIMLAVLTILIMTALPLTANLVLASTQTSSSSTTVKTDAAIDQVLQGTSSMVTANAAPADTATSAASSSSSATTDQVSGSADKQVDQQTTASETALTKATVETPIPETFGTVTWYLNDAGELHLSGGSFEDSLKPYQENVTSTLHGNSPWVSLSDSITKVVIDGEITPLAGTEYSYLFANLTSLVSVEGLGKLKLTGITSIAAMFNRCRRLTQADTSSWDTSTVTTMNYAFNDCESLSTLAVGNWNLENIISLSYVFNGCTVINGLDVSKWRMPKAITIENLFAGCENLTAVDVSNWETGTVRQMSQTFSGCRLLKTIDVSNWDVSSAVDMSGIFQNCVALETLPIDHWDVSKVTGLQRAFTNMGVPDLKLNFADWHTDSLTDITEVFGWSKIKTLDLQSWNVSKVQLFKGAFKYCETTTLKISDWDTSHATSFDSLFFYSKIPELAINHWDTSQVTDLTKTFSNTKFTSLDISDWDTRAATDSNGMFGASNNLKHLKIGPNFRFHGITAGLTAASSVAPYFREWCYEDGSDGQSYTASTLMTNYDEGTMPAGDYYWAKKGTVIVKYVDSDGNQIAEPDTLYGKLGDTYETQAKTIEGYGNIAEQPENATGTYAAGVINVEYRYTGLVSFATASPTMSFKSVPISAGTMTIPLSSVGTGISVRDTRRTGSEWTVTAQLLGAGFVSESSGANLAAKLYYQSPDTGDQTEIGQASPVSIMTQTSNSRNPVVITDHWTSGTGGLNLQVAGNTTRAEKYVGQIEWGVVEGVPNN